MTDFLGPAPADADFAEGEHTIRAVWARDGWRVKCGRGSCRGVVAVVVESDAAPGMPDLGLQPGFTRLSRPGDRQQLDRFQLAHTALSRHRWPQTRPFRHLPSHVFVRCPERGCERWNFVAILELLDTWPQKPAWQKGLRPPSAVLTSG